MRLNSFSGKWALTGWTKCCPKTCPLASEWELLAEKKTAPSRGVCGLKGQNKMADSRKDAMMTRRAGELLLSILEPNQSSSLCAATGSVGLCPGCTQEPSEVRLFCALVTFFPNQGLGSCFECITNASWCIRATDLLLLEWSD